MQTEDLILSKVIFALKFEKQNNGILINKNEILMEFEDNFKDSEMITTNVISMNSLDGKLGINLTVNSIDMYDDSNRGLKESMDNFITIINKINKRISIKVSSRVGFRCFWIRKFSTKESVEDYIIKKYMHPNLSSNGFTSRISEPQIRFSGRHKTLGYNFGIAHYEEKTIELKGNLINEEKIISDNLLIDLDVFRDESFGINHITEYFSKVDSVIEEMNTFLSKMGG